MYWSRTFAPPIPTIIAPGEAGEDDLALLLHYVNTARASLRQELARAGAILLRGFQVNAVEQFDRLTEALLSSRTRYRGGDARRRLMTDYVYTSNDTAGEKYISVHNEMGYSRKHPEIVVFYCARVEMSGGETLLTDGRQVLRQLSHETVQAFSDSAVTYVQNLPAEARGAPEWAKTWCQTFESDNREEVERTLTLREARFHWAPDATLHVEETVPAIIVNAITGERALFCQADRWHASQYDDGSREAVLAIPGGDRYHHCVFANGDEIAHGQLEELGRVKKALAVGHRWQAGDVLVLDNTITLHGRSPYQGRRELYVAMGTF